MELRPYQWGRLSRQQAGAYTEYFVKMELTMYGFQVYTSEVDDRGVDFVARYESGPFVQVQVKSLRSLGYVFMQKSKLILDENTFIAFGLLLEGKPPLLYLIPSTVWRTPGPTFVSRDYEGKESDPEWGINVSAKNLPALEPYLFATTIGVITQFENEQLALQRLT
jgi:hypothetical protein